MCEGSVPHTAAPHIANPTVLLMGAAWKSVFSFPHMQAPDSGCGTSFL